MKFHFINQCRHILCIFIYDVILILFCEFQLILGVSIGKLILGIVESENEWLRINPLQYEPVMNSIILDVNLLFINCYVQ